MSKKEFRTGNKYFMTRRANGKYEGLWMWDREKREYRQIVGLCDLQGSFAKIRWRARKYL